VSAICGASCIKSISLALLLLCAQRVHNKHIGSLSSAAEKERRLFASLSLVCCLLHFSDARAPPVIALSSLLLLERRVSITRAANFSPNHIKFLSKKLRELKKTDKQNSGILMRNSKFYKSDFYFHLFAIHL
jgi:hypothetical protein